MRGVWTLLVGVKIIVIGGGDVVLLGFVKPLFHAIWRCEL